MSKQHEGIYKHLVFSVLFSEESDKILCRDVKNLMEASRKGREHRFERSLKQVQDGILETIFSDAEWGWAVRQS